MLLSCVFTIHTNFRIDESTLTNPKQAELIFLQLKESIKISPPPTFIFTMDSDQIKLKDPDQVLSPSLKRYEF